MAIEAEALRDALRLALKFVDRAGGEGLGFVADAHNGYPETDAADVCEAVAKALGIEFGGTEYMALIGDGPLPILIHRSALAEDTARAAEGDVLATGWLTHMGREDGEERGPVVRFVLDASREHALKFAHIWNGATYEIRALPLDKEAADANR